jgi:hypothetical protein
VGLETEGATGSPNPRPTEQTQGRQHDEKSMMKVGMSFIILASALCRRKARIHKLFVESILLTFVKPFERDRCK